MLKYTIVKQRNPFKENEEDMYYPRLTGRNIYDIDDVADIISSRSSLSKSDVVATLIALEDVIPEALIGGHKVKLGNLGSFSLQAGASTSPEKALVSWRNFRKLTTRFSAGKSLKIHLWDVHFQRIGN